MSPGYYTDRVPWGFGKHLGAYSTSSGKTLWTHSEPTVIDSRSLGVCEDRLYFYAPESRIGCIDADSGSVLWSTNDPEVMEKLEMKGQGLVSTPGFRSNCNILCTEDVVFFEAQTHLYVLALSAKDGSLLWFREKTRNNPTLLYVDGKLITSHLISGTLAVDPLTGREEQKLNFSKVNCVRMNATPDAFYCRGEGLGVYDRETDTYKVDGSVRPGCNDGALPANGLLYVGPWACDCNLSLIGTVTLCSAGDFDFNVVATNESNLQLGAGDPATVQPLDASDLDWPTYRANTQRSGSSQVALKEEHPVPGWWHKPTDACKVTPPVAAGGLVFFGREDGKVRCLNAETGDVAWDYVTAGPIIQPPTIWEGRCYVGSGDGYVYCIEAATGRLLWRFRAAPVERRMMVYDHLMSTWPVNSGILIEDGVAYAAAGIIDRDGTYVYALDAKTGEIAWQNNGTGHIDPDLRKGASVQGGLAIGGGRLWLAGGNQVSPTPFDLKTGECKNWLKPQGRPSTPRGREIGVWM
ncbi:MAG TPA: PQQ-binding-like beta-propeller repeat protein, partial [Armatimonadota bacterium]|nr:PQQ-binding-like beta-propeller repeat protein [Armatimonadota bacterium]